MLINWQSVPDAPGVYIYQWIGHPIIKVGESRSMRTRIRTQLTAIPFDVRVVGYIEITDREDRRWTERRIHEAASAHRLRSECFSVEALGRVLSILAMDTRATVV